MTKEEIIEKIKDKLLQNAISEYNNEADRCGDYRTDKKIRQTYDDIDQKLWEERIYLMQDYDEIMHNSNLSEIMNELNYNYN